MLIAPQGQDILFSEERLEVGRNFMNKVWNAARFILMNLDENTVPKEQFEPAHLKLELADEWILSRLNATIHVVDKNLKKYRFDEVARIIYDFVWSDYCDWYIELIKDRLYKKSPAEKQTALQVAIYVLKNFLKLLHPYAPFITEEIYQHIKSPAEPDIIIAPWPQAITLKISKDSIDKIVETKNIITQIRTKRSELNISPAIKPRVSVLNNQTSSVGILTGPPTESYVRKLANLENISLVVTHPVQSIPISTGTTTTYIHIDNIVDPKSEIEKMEKEIKRLEVLLKSVRAKLTNQDFLSKAPREIVEKEHKKEQKLIEQLKKQEEILRLYKIGNII